MKKLIFCVLTLLLCAAAALASGDTPAYVLKGDAVISGMERSWDQGYQPTVSAGTLTICMPVTAESSNGKLKATLIMEDETASPFKKQTMSVTVWRDSGLFSVRLKLRLLSDYENGDYRCRVLLEGQDRDGNAISTEYPMVLRLRDGQKPVGKIQPKVSGIASDLILGEDSMITATLSNPNLRADMEGITLTVTDDTGEVLPRSSNLIPLGSLASGETRAIEVPLTVLGSAKVTLHQFKFEFTYTALGEEATYAETFSLPVNQEIRLEHGGAELDAAIVQGDMATITLPLMNMGRSEVQNALVTLDIPDVADGRSVLVGTIAPGESKNAKLTFVPGEEVLGDIEGTLHVSCEDEWGNVEKFDLPIATMVEAAPVKTASVSGAESASAKERPDWMIPALGGGCGLMLIALILQGAIFRKKIHRLEEDRL